ncbi:hypothetical protein OC861_006540 [Tilletia horrida]|nr:hypothetical protein OC861_006540 [Tilletia horrida]
MSRRGLDRASDGSASPDEVDDNRLTVDHIRQLGADVTRLQDMVRALASRITAVELASSRPASSTTFQTTSQVFMNAAASFNPDQRSGHDSRCDSYGSVLLKYAPSAFSRNIVSLCLSPSNWIWRDMVV